jgi:hypothetical protein
LEKIHELITFSARTQNTFQEYEHQQTVRRIAFEQAALTTTHMELLNENQRLQNYKLQAEATTAGWEAKISELDYQVRDEQFKKMMKEMQNE